MVVTKKAIIPLIVLAVFIIVALLIFNNPPEAKRSHLPSKPQLTVETLALKQAPYQVRLQSYGTVRPRIESQLVAQVSGQIVEVSPQFRNGGFFERGDQLVRIDSRDYEAEVNIAKAALISAEQLLAEEQARSEQALEDWRRLGNTTQASDLVLRKPQLQAAQAQVISAQSALDKVQLNLERTRILAPFAGRILNKQVDVGEVVSNNMPLASIYATDYVEIRLPLKNRDLDYIRLPESYRFNATQNNEPVAVTIYSDLVGDQIWQGKIVRTEGAIDGTSRQLHVVAQIDDPYGAQATGKQPLKIGEYVTAQIQGIRLENALVIPNSSIYQGSYVYLVEQGRLLRRNIEIAWQNDHEAIIQQGLITGDQLVLTPLGQVASGIPVKVLNPSVSNVAQPLALVPEKGKTP
ncbi:MAG: efflux RND transporter periplasmic adaptor subunit [Pseudomonadales bacterium]|nr:efflux RND transporter periplasmic adaptor subunit [Pseudomonadales bacterium]MCP5214989.1 efflux RND transporter periplasmic adaptor subunit [Pseudomonadales bacterium]